LGGGSFGCLFSRTEPRGSLEADWYGSCEGIEVNWGGVGGQAVVVAAGRDGVGLCAKLCVWIVIVVGVFACFFFILFFGKRR